MVQEDYLEVDDPINGQNYVCLSFVSPETLIQNKEAFKTAKFLQSMAHEKKRISNIFTICIKTFVTNIMISYKKILTRKMI